MRARLVREIPVRLLNLSRSGCLVESDSEISVGMTGVLLVELWGVPCRYPMRVSRAFQQSNGSYTFHLGAEFSWRELPARSVSAISGPGQDTPSSPLSRG